MKLLFDFFPIVLFFVTYKLYGIYAATVVAMVASGCQVSYSWFKHRKVETMHLITFVLILVMGGATLYLQDELFIKWKPTLINWLFGAAFLGSHFFGEKTFIERMMQNNLTLPRPIWRRLNLGWAFFFGFLGSANVYVVYSFDTDTWVNFKLFGMLGLTLVFVVLQTAYLYRHIPQTEE